MSSYKRGSAASTSETPVSRRLVTAVMMGTLLNPLNSSMIAVALALLQSDFKVSVTTASWLISGFYLAAAVGQPLMGRLSDQFGPRRIFCISLVLVGLVGALAPLSPSFAWLVAFRVLQAFGTSGAFPAGLAMIRRNASDPNGRPPATALGAISVASSVSAALGPVLGGALVAVAGWPAIFLVNVPVTAVGFVISLRWLPGDSSRKDTTASASELPIPTGLYVLKMVDLPGIVLFSATLASLLFFLLSLSTGPIWALLPVAPVTAMLLALRELRVASPFFDLRMLAANLPLVGVFVQYAAVNLVFYSVFFSLPLWLEQARRFEPSEAGLLVLPIAGLGVLATPVAARLISRSGARPSLIIGALALTVGSLLLLLFRSTTPVVVILCVGAVLGVPNGFNNLGLQAALYEHTPVESTGAAGGLFQTFRYVGAILSTSIIGLVFSSKVTSGGLHAIALALAIISALILIASITTRQPQRNPV